MLVLQWDELDLLEVLGVPEAEEYETSHAYTVARGSLTLLLTVWQYERIIQVSLVPEDTGKAIISYAVVVRGGVRRKRQKGSEYLEFEDCVVVPGRFYYQTWGHVVEDGCYPKGLQMEVTVTPDLHVRFR